MTLNSGLVRLEGSPPLCKKKKNKQKLRDNEFNLLINLYLSFSDYVEK